MPIPYVRGKALRPDEYDALRRAVRYALLNIHEIRIFNLLI